MRFFYGWLSCVVDREWHDDNYHRCSCYSITKRRGEETNRTEEIHIKAKQKKDGSNVIMH